MYTTFQHNSKHYTYAGIVEALVVRGYITAGQIQFHLVHIELKGIQLSSVAIRRLLKCMIFRNCLC